MGVKLGTLDITFKIGSADTTVYLGDTMIQSGDTPTPTPPTPTNYKWLATYTGGTTSSAECDASSAITSGEITLTDLVSVEIGDCVTSIGDGVFFDCYSLSSVTIPDSVTSIGIRTFQYCSGLTSVTIGSGVTSIGQYAFRYCSGLTSIDIPSGVTSIGSSAFNGCSSLTSITCLSTTPPTLSGKQWFNNTNDCPIYVPSASVSAYQSDSKWSTYASRIQAIPNDNQNPNQGGGEPNIGGFDDDEEIPDN